MKTQTGFIATLAFFLGVGSAAAAPICPEFTKPEMMPKKYERYAPIFSDGPDGWIIDSDQMKKDFAPSKESMDLIKQISQEFESRGVPLAVLIPPPRPLVAGSDKLSELGAEYDVVKAGRSFTALINILREAGVVAPDLLKLALSSDTMQDSFYFRQDRHWTPTGAAHSALALSEEIRLAYPGRFPDSAAVKPSDLTQGPLIEEPGSLANIARKVCNAELASETAQTLVFPAASGSLLSDDDNDKPVIALAGSSFSDRYKRDLYRVADSLAGALGAEVENYSVSGGGAIGGLESLILSGDLSAKRFDLVIWELPYTERFRSPHFLRQLLGALRYDPANQDTGVIAIDERNRSLKLDLRDHPASELVIRLPESDVQKITARLGNASNKRKTIKLVRKDRVPADRRSDIWAVSLEALEGQQFTELTLEFVDGAPGPNATAVLRP